MTTNTQTVIAETQGRILEYRAIVVQFTRLIRNIVQAYSKEDGRLSAIAWEPPSIPDDECVEDYVFNLGSRDLRLRLEKVQGDPVGKVCISTLRTGASCRPDDEKWSSVGSFELDSNGIASFYFMVPASHSMCEVQDSEDCIAIFLACLYKSFEG